MAHSFAIITVVFVMLSCSLVEGYTFPKSITIVNKCNYPVVTSIISSNPGTLPALATSGFTLQPGDSETVEVPPAWSGRITGHFTLQCREGTIPPWGTAAEFIFNGNPDEDDIYGVSVAGGYSIPMNAEPTGGINGTIGNCLKTECVKNLNELCVFDGLKVMSNDGELIGCESPCQASGDPQFCCTGAYATPDACKPNPYSLFVKDKCPLARSHVFDQSFTCVTDRYSVTFCPPITSLMAPQMEKSPAMKLNLQYLIYAIIGVLASASGITIYVKCRPCKIKITF